MLKAHFPQQSRTDTASILLSSVHLEEIASKATLDEAWKRVRANKGGPGGDGVTIENFGLRAEASLAALQSALLGGSYRPGKLRRCQITKPDGRKRRLSVPSIIDQIAQTAALVALSPNLEMRMSDDSFGYRPGRGVDQALARARAAMADGKVWIAECDIARFFDRVPHVQILAELTIWLQDERVLRLFASWLKSFSWWGRGIAQGSPVSPLLANLYLHPIDLLTAAEGYILVRYADDFVILAATKDEAGKALGLVDRLLRRRGLMLNRKKTAIVPPGKRVIFLGEDLCAPPKERKVASNAG